MNLTPVEISAFVVGACMALSKVLNVGRDLWSMLPKPVSMILPAVVVCLPQIADAFGVVHTTGDLLVAVVAAAALVAHGVHDAKKNA